MQGVSETGPGSHTGSPVEQALPFLQSKRVCLYHCGWSQQAAVSRADPLSPQWRMGAIWQRRAWQPPMAKAMYRETCNQQDQSEIIMAEEL